MSAATSTASIKDQLASERFSLMPEVAVPALPERSTVPDREAIARLAHEYWEERLENNISGSAEDDWYRAEEDLGF